MEPAVHTKEWSAPVRTTVTGEPPKPDVPTETSRSELRRHDLRFITPLYKTEATTNGKPESELITEAKVQTRPLDRPADYRVEKEEETYRLHMIDPKTEPVRTEVTSRTLPADLRRIRKPLDFPSSHSHCSFIKLNPLERPQRQRLRSVEVRPITPHDYLSESLERHRAISLSPLRSKLKVDEKSVNEPWQRISRLERKDVPPSWRTLEKEDSYSIAEGVPPYRFRERPSLSPTCFSECDPRDGHFYDSYTPAILLLPPSVGAALSPRVEDHRPSTYALRTRKRLPHEILTSLVERQRNFYSEQKSGFTGQEDRESLSGRPGGYFTRGAPMPAPYGSSQSVNNPVNSGCGRNEGYRIGAAAPWRYRAAQRPYAPKSETSHGNEPCSPLRENWPRPSSAPLFKEKITLPMRRLPVAEEEEEYSFAYDDFNERVSFSERSSRGRDIPKAYYDERLLGARGTSESSGFESPKQADKRKSRQDVACQYDPVGQVSVALQSHEATDPEGDRTGQGLSTFRDQETVQQAPAMDTKLSAILEEKEAARKSAHFKQSVLSESQAPTVPTDTQRVDDSQTTSTMCELLEMTRSKTWRRTYPVETPTDVVKSRIVCGKEVLATDAFLIDMEARRRKFLESPPAAPQINRTGRTWRMPDVEPYEYPERRTPLRTFECVDDKHHFWKPELVEPLYKRETKRFTPPPSPQQFPPDIRGQSSQSDFDRTRRLFEQVMVATRRVDDASQHPNAPSPQYDVADPPKEKASPASARRPSVTRTSGFDLRKSPRVTDDVSHFLAEHSPHRRSPLVKETYSAQYERRENSRRSFSEYPIPQRAAARQQEMAEMAEIRKKLLENARNRSTVNVNEVSKVEAELLPIPSPTKCQSQTNVASWEYNNAFSPRSVVSINGHTNNRGLLRIRTDLSPAASKFQSVPKSNVSVQTYGQTAPVAPQVVPLQAVLLPIGAASSFTSEWTRDYRTVHEVDGKFPSGDAGDTGSRQSTLIKIKDEHAKKPKSIMKQQKLATEESRSENVRRAAAREETPQVTETIEKIEETTTTEEVERRIRGRSKRDKRERHHGRKGEHRHLGYARGRAGALGWAQQRSATFDDPPWTTPFGASQDSPWRHRPMVQGNYEHRQTSQPTVRETYHREVKSKKVHDSGSNGAYYRTPEYRRRDDYWRDDYGRGSDFHKSYSSRNIFHNEFADDFDTQYPIVEFPPTLPRDSDAHQQRHHHVQKSRSLLDWEDQRRADMMRSRRAWDDGMDDLERDFRDSLLMPMPPYGGNLKQREYREQEIPGGHETFSREVTAQSGTRPYSASGRGGSSGGVTHFKESKQEMQYKKEHTTDRL
uniref:Uncharacterized protein n=1 Tax=Trichuris muris TaxID=70415 RepID=A0A5S6QLE2_TRIMR